MKNLAVVAAPTDIDSFADGRQLVVLHVRDFRDHVRAARESHFDAVMIPAINQRLDVRRQRVACRGIGDSEARALGAQGQHGGTVVTQTVAAPSVAEIEDAPRPADEPTVAEVIGAPPAADVDETIAMPWRPVFDERDDLGGVLAAETPLLARAFKRTDRPR